MIVTSQFLIRKGIDVATIEPTADLRPPSSCWRHVALARWSFGPTGGSRVSSRSGTLSVLGQVMTRKVVTCSRAETMSSIMELMTAGKFRHLPVVEEGQLVGIVSIGDVVKHRVQEIEFESATLRDYIRTA